MQILLTNTYSHRNKGDGGIVQGILSSFWAVDEDVGFTLVSLDPQADRTYYTDPRIEVIEAPVPVPDPEAGKTAQARHWLAQLLWRFPTSWAGARGDGRWASPEARRFLARAREADLALACGGGYLHDSFRMGLYVHLAQLWLADRAGLDVHLLPQSIGPASGIERRLLARTLARAEHVYVREPVSESFVQHLDVDVPLTLAPDPAFALEADPTSAAREAIDAVHQLEPPVVGFTVRRWHFPGLDQTQARYERYLAAYGDLFRDHEDVDFVFVPQVTGPGDDDDRIALADLEELMGWSDRPANVHSLDPELTPRELIAAIARMDAFVGTRMHSNVFALCGRVPTLAVSYLPKTDGIMEMLGLEDWVLDIAELTPHKLRDGFQRLMRARQGYAQRLAARMPEVQTRARQPARDVLDAQLAPTPASR
jgi:colanic acid/amylovoran biosynthesis protein